MCRRRRGAGLAAILVVAGYAAPVAAQERPARSPGAADSAGASVVAAPAHGPAPASTEEARLLARLDTLRDRVRALEEPSPTRRSGSGAVALDTFMVHGLRVVTPAEDVATVTAWVEEAVASVEARLGPIPTVARPPTLTVDWRPITVSGHGAGQVRITGMSAATVRRTLQSGLAQVLIERTPGPVRSWLAGPLGTEASAHDELAAVTTPPVPDCRAGDTDACATALGLTPGSPPALGPDVRRSFLHHLLRSRPDALARLMTTVGGTDPAGETDPTGDDLRAILERAAGTSLDPILDDWREAVLTDRPTPAPAAAATTVAWVLLLLGLATRSTRCRTA